MRPAANPAPAGYETAAVRRDVCAPGSEPSPCRLRNSRRPEGRVSTRRHLPDGLPDHRARATRRGECSVIANHTPNGMTPNTTRNDTPSPPPCTLTRHHTPRARHQGHPPTPQPPSSPATTTTTTRHWPPTTSPTTPSPPAALATPSRSTPPSAPHHTCHTPTLHTTH